MFDDEPVFHESVKQKWLPDYYGKPTRRAIRCNIKLCYAVQSNKLDLYSDIHIINMQ